MFLRQFGEINFSVRFTAPSLQHIDQVRQHLAQYKIGINSYRMEERVDTEGHPLYTVNLDLHVRRNRLRQQMLDILASVEGITIEVVE